MFAKERQQQIAAFLKEKGSVTTLELMTHFSVSIETIRRDLLAMEENKLLYRVHGGAVAVEDMKPAQNLSQRVHENSQSKLELCRTAASLVREGDVIGVDSGSTALVFAQALKERLHRLTVVTHSLDVFESLCRHEEFQLILCGGHFLASENAFYGPLVLETLEKLHLQKVFICPSAISLQYGICDFQPDLLQIQRKLLHHGDAVFFLADSSKFERKVLLKLDEMRPHYHYVTDSSLRPGLKAMYADHQIKILTGIEDTKGEK